MRKEKATHDFENKIEVTSSDDKEQQEDIPEENEQQETDNGYVADPHQQYNKKMEEEQNSHIVQETFKNLDDNEKINAINELNAIMAINPNEFDNDEFAEDFNNSTDEERQQAIDRVHEKTLDKHKIKDDLLQDEFDL